jgi:hypothetical protein
MYISDPAFPHDKEERYYVVFAGGKWSNFTKESQEVKGQVSAHMDDKLASLLMTGGRPLPMAGMGGHGQQAFMSLAALLSGFGTLSRGLV